MITKVQTNITERNYEYGHATKSMHCNKLLRTLVENMNKRGATFDEIAIFQSDFCNANNIEIPDSFFPNQTIMDDILDEILTKSIKNEKALDVYNAYVSYCQEKGLRFKNKGAFFFELRQRNLISETGTVDGKTYRNVVRGYEIKWKKMEE